MTLALMHAQTLAQHVTRSESQGSDRRCSALGGLGQRGMQLQRPRRLPAWRVSGYRRSRAVVMMARGAGVAPPPTKRPVRHGAASSEDAKRAQRHMLDLYSSNSHVQMIWDLQADVKRQIKNRFGLQPAQTRLTDGEGRALFHSEDVKTCFDIEVHEGEASPVMWLNTPRSVLGEFVLGGRVNTFVSSCHSYAPNLDIELYHYPLFGKLFMYLNLVPRRSLIQHPEDVELFYLTPHAGGATYQQLFEECEGRKDWEPHPVTDAFVRALTGSTSLMYQMDATEDNANEIRSLSERVHSIWAALVDSSEVPTPRSAEDASQRTCDQRALAETDAMLLQYAKRDPDVQKAVPLIGEQGVHDMLALLSRDDAIFVH